MLITIWRHKKAMAEQELRLIQEHKAELAKMRDDFKELADDFKTLSENYKVLVEQMKVSHG